MSVDGERKAIRFILQQLIREGEEWARDASRAAKAAKRAATGRFVPLDTSTLHHQFQNQPLHGDFGESAVYIAPPQKEGNVPIALWCRWNFGGTRAAAKYYLGMWLTSSRFIGYRFEPPERGDLHNYYHSQPCKVLGRREGEIKGALPIPISAPTWPLAATSAVELLLCVVLSVRGMAGLQDLRKSVVHNSAARQNRVLMGAVENVLLLRA